MSETWGKRFVHVARWSYDILLDFEGDSKPDFNVREIAGRTKRAFCRHCTTSDGRQSAT